MKLLNIRSFKGRREDAGVCRRTLANLTNRHAEKGDTLRRVLKGRRRVSPEAAFTIERPVPHDHVGLLPAMLRRLGLDRPIASEAFPRARPCRGDGRGEHVMRPASEPGTTRLRQAATLAEELGLGGAGEDAPYGAPDWPLAHRGRTGRRPR